MFKYLIESLHYNTEYNSVFMKTETDLEKIVDYPNRKEFIINPGEFSPFKMVEEKVDEKIKHTIDYIVQTIESKNDKENYLIVLPYGEKYAIYRALFEYELIRLREGEYYENQEKRIVKNLNVITGLPEGKESIKFYEKTIDYLFDLLWQRINIGTIPVDQNLRINIKDGTINDYPDKYSSFDLADIRRRLEERLEAAYHSKLIAAISLLEEDKDHLKSEVKGKLNFDKSGIPFVFYGDIIIKKNERYLEEYGVSPTFIVPELHS